jgi:hypothetical protein
MTSQKPEVALLFQIGERQRGLVTTEQIRTCGIGYRMQARLVADGWLRQVRLGVYAFAGRTSRWEDAVAVGLLVGEEAALSHWTAAGIHRLPGIAPRVQPEVSIKASRHVRMPGVVVHRVAHLESVDIQQRYGVGVTTPARTLVDLATHIDRQLLERVVDEGAIERRWTANELAACVARTAPGGRRGSRDLRAVLAERLDEPVADSVLERRIIRVLAPFAPFETQYQLVLEGRLIILDVAWPQWLIGAECDGWSVRSRSRGKFYKDREHFNLLKAHHWQVAHLTAAMDTDAVLYEVGRFLPAAALLGRKGHRHRVG